MKLSFPVHGTQNAFYLMQYNWAIKKKKKVILDWPQHLHFNDRCANCCVYVALSIHFHLHFYSSLHPPSTLSLSYCVSFLVKAQLFAICLSHPFAGTPSMKTRQFGVKWRQASIWAYVCMCACVCVCVCVWTRQGKVRALVGGHVRTVTQKWKLLPWTHTQTSVCVCVCVCVCVYVCAHLPVCTHDNVKVTL